MNQTTKKITTLGLLLAICIASQFVKGVSVYLTGPIINTCLFLATFTTGIGGGVALAMITPITAYIISPSPVMTAVPTVILGIMLGNAVVVLCAGLFDKKIKKSCGKLIGMVVGSVAKGAVMGLVIGYLLLPNLLPDKMMKMLPVFQASFSITQITTALIGAAYVVILWIPLKKVFEEN